VSVSERVGIGATSAGGIKWRTFTKDGDISYSVQNPTCLVCTIGTPVADMLAHSPRLPLIIDHVYERRDFTAEDEKGMALALKQCDRLRMYVTDLWKFIMAISEEYPILEYLIMGPLTQERPILRLCNTFRAPHLRRLLLIGFKVTPPIGFWLLTAAWASSYLVLPCSTRPPTSSQLSCDNGLHSCLSWNRS
jgi:hypothetical protein